MKKTLLFISFLALLASCTSEDQDREEAVVACFNLSKSVLELGEELQITNCSSGADSYLFEFLNGETSTLAEPTTSYTVPGTYTIRLTATSPNGNTSTATQTVSVNTINNNLIFLPVLDGDSAIPIDAGFNNQKLYYIENYQNVLANTPSGKHNYVELDLSSKTIQKTYLADRNYNSGHASITTLDNNDKIVYTTRTITNYYGVKQIKTDNLWNIQSTQDIANRTVYGSVTEGSDRLFYGSYRISGTSNPSLLYHQPSIEITDGSGNFTDRKVYQQINQGFIGDMIKTSAGFMAFGGSTNPLTFSTFDSYRPLIIFLDSNYDYINHVTFDNSVIDATAFNELNGSFHIQELSNGNYITYSHNEYRIIDSTGVEVFSDSFSGQNEDIQGLIALENDGFILTTKEDIHKYDVNGTLIKSIKTNGLYTADLVLKDNRIYIVSGYSSSYDFNGNGNISAFKMFVGAVDKDLQIINLNN